MDGVFIGSTAARAGKSLLTFSLGVLMQRAGLNIGYMKPLGGQPQKKDELPGDADALVVQEVLGQNVPADILTPLMLPDNLHALAMHGVGADDGGAMRRIKESYNRIRAGKDLTLVAGEGSFPAAGRFAGADGLSMARSLDLKVLLVERFNRGFNHDELLLLKDELGDRLIGVVLNDVPEKDMRDAAKVLTPWLLEHGIAVRGVIRHEPELMGMRVLEVARGLGGRVVAGNVQTSAMASGFVIGAMQVDNFMMHLRQRPNSAVIVGGDRSDLQLAALIAGCPCVVLTGNIPPSELIRSRAESLGVAMIVVREDTYSVARSMSRIRKSKKIRDLAQIRIGMSMVEEAVDLYGILKAVNPELCSARG